MSVGGPDRPVGGLAVRPPAGVELRPAAREDLGAALALLEQRTGQPTELSRDVAAARWDGLLNSIDASPFLAIADGDTVGLLLLSFRRRLNFATWEGWVPELVVSDDHRGRGIGRALLRVAIEEWRLRGAHRLSVEVALDEAAGRALLSGMGFAESLLRFSLDPIPETVASEATIRPSLTLREIREDDFGAASRLVAEMGPHRSPLPDRMDAVERAYREIVRRPSDGSLIAERDGAAIGICTLEIRTTLRRDAPEAWVPELVVTEQFRGQGIGRALLERVLQTARDRGAQRAVLESGAQRATAQALYRSVGFEAAGSVFTLLRDR
jgi:GNAT superfamily N-acetyltransferase